MNRFRQNKQEASDNQAPQKSPMREFKDEPTEGTPSIFRRRLNIVIYWVLPVFIIIAILSGGIFLGIHYYTSSGDKDDGEGQSEFLGFGTDVSAPELLEAYINAIGGRESLRKVRSVRYQGRLVSSSGEYDFLGVLLKPDKGMLVTKSEKIGSIKLMLNGETAWQVIERRDGSREVLPLNESTKKSLQWSLRVNNSFRSLALQAQYAGLDVRETVDMGKQCYEVTKTNADGTKLKALLDKETLYLIKTEETLVSGEDKDILTVVYEDHRFVSGVVEAFKTKLYRNGELDNEAIVSSYRINPGLVSSLFAVPEGLGE